jgi:hypothetical protein
MEAGKMIHKAVLEPDTFADDYQVLDSKDDYLQTVDDLKNQLLALGVAPAKGNKSALICQLLELCPDAKIWETYISAMEQTGKVSISHEDWHHCTRIIEEVRRHGWLNQAMHGGLNEQYAYWRHESGVWISMRMDRYHPGMGIHKKKVVIDLKKTVSAHPTDFSKQIFNHGMYIQAAMYVDGVKAITGDEPVFAWAAVEDKPPYVVEAYAADYGCIEAGRAVYNKMIYRYLECKAKNEWPSYGSGKVVNISLPHWGFQKLDEFAESELED